MADRLNRKMLFGEVAMGIPTKAPRRSFLQAAGGVLLLKPQTVLGSQANSAVEVGLVGCGGRGNWIGKFFPEFTGARVVALADVIQDHLDKTRDAFKVESQRSYYGPEAYKELAHSKLDAGVIEIGRASCRERG